MFNDSYIMVTPTTKNKGTSRTS